jgi:hypothetical protein
LIRKKQYFNSTQHPSNEEDVETMEEKKQRKISTDLEDLDEPEQLILTEPESIEIASGYSISVKYDKDGRPIIYVKKYGEVDTRGLRREIERNYPGAHIQGLEKPKSVEMEDDQRKTPKRPHVKKSKQR